MRGRFGAKSSGGVLKGVLPTAVFFVVVVAFFFWMVTGMTASVESEQLKGLAQAIRRTAVHCYAVEGQYPPSLAYMEDHYGLQIDQERYVVHYQPVAANLMPTIDVFPMSELDSPASEERDLFALAASGNAGQTVIIDDDDAI